MREAGDAGVWGFEGGVMGLAKRSPSAFCPREAGEPIIVADVWDMKLSTVSMPMGDGGLSSSVVERRREWLAMTVSSTNILRNVWKYQQCKYLSKAQSESYLISFLISKHYHFMKLSKAYVHIHSVKAAQL